MASEVAGGILGLSKDRTPKKSTFIMATASLAKDVGGQILDASTKKKKLVLIQLNQVPEYE